MKEKEKRKRKRKRLKRKKKKKKRGKWDIKLLGVVTLFKLLQP